MEKLSDIANTIALHLSTFCSCDIPANHIADERMDCVDESIVFQGRLIIPNDKNSSELREILTQWVSTNPSVVIQGVKLEGIDTCPVILADFETEGCASGTKHHENTLGIALGSVFGILIIILIIFTAVIVCFFCKR